MTSACEELRLRGNAAFKAGDHTEAIAQYTAAIAAAAQGGGDDAAAAAAVLLSNRCAAHAAAGHAKEALSDALALVAARPRWAKAHFRLAQAQALLCAGAGGGCEAVRAGLLALRECERCGGGEVRALRTRLEALGAASAAHLAGCAPVRAGAVVVRPCADFAARGRGVFFAGAADGAAVFSEAPLVSHVEAAASEAYCGRCCAHCMHARLAPEQIRTLQALVSIHAAEAAAPVADWASEQLQLQQQCALVQCARCKERYCSDACRDAAEVASHRLLCGGTPGGELMDDFRRRCRALGLTNPLCIARMAATVASDVVFRSVPLGDALRPFASFCWNTWPSDNDEELSGLLHEALRRNGVPCDVADAVASLDAFRMLNGVLQRNASRVHPLSDFHVFLNQACGKTIPEDVVRALHTAPWVGDLTCGGTALFAIANSINHSCKPNVQFCSASPDHRILVLSVEPLTPGTELLVSYIDETQPYAQRQEELQRKYRFQCRCSRCEEEGGK